MSKRNILKLSVSVLMALFFLPTVNAQNQNGSFRAILKVKSVQGTTGMKKYLAFQGNVEPSLVFKPGPISVKDWNRDQVAEFSDNNKVFYYPGRPSGELHEEDFLLYDMTKTYNSSSGSIDLRRGGSFNTRFDRLEVNGGSHGFHHYSVPTHSYPIAYVTPAGNVSSDFTISIKGEASDGSIIKYPYHFNFETSYYIDAIEANLKIQNAAGDEQTVFCERQLIKIVAEYKRPFHNGNFEFQKSYDGGTTWETLPSYQGHKVTYDYATQSGVIYRARLVASSGSYGVSNYNSFKATSNTNITVLPQLTDISYQTFGVCPGNTNGSVKINGLPGAIVGNEYLITIQDDAGYSESVTLLYSNNHFTDNDLSFSVPTGTYSVSATNLSLSARCGILKENISVKESYTPEYGYWTNPIICPGDIGKIHLRSQHQGNASEIVTLTLLDTTEQSWTRIVNRNRNYTTFNPEAGAYQVTVVNSDLCFYEVPDTIFIEPADSVLTSISANTIQELDNVEYHGCSGETTALQLNISGGNPPYRIWEHLGSGGSNGILYYTNGSSFTIPRKGAGAHTFSVRDARGCVSERDTFMVQTIPVVNFPTLNVSTPTTVCGAVLDDGAIEQLTPATGGFPPYSLYFNGTEVSSFDTMNMPNARARLSIVDSSGCVATIFPALLNTGFLRIIDYEGLQGPIDPCGVNSLSYVTINVYGGTIASEYTLTINGTPCVAPQCLVTTSLSGPSAEYQIQIDTAGVYDYQVTDDTGCSMSYVDEYAQVTIPKVASMSSVPPSCTNGTHMVTFLIEDLEFPENQYNSYITYILDGVPGASSLLESGGIPILPYQFTIPVTGDSMHQIVLETQTNCVSSTPFEFSLEGVSSIAIDVSSIEMSQCSYDTSGTIIFSMGGNAPHVVELFKEGIRQDSALIFSGQHRYDNLLTGNYRIDITDNSGCTQSENNIILTSPSPIQATLSNMNAIDCTGNNGLIQISNIIGGVPPYQFSLNGRTFQSDTLLVGAMFENEVIVRDSNNCELNLAWDVPLAGPTLFPTITSILPVSDCTLGKALLSLPAGFTYPLSVVEIENPNSYFSDKEQRIADSLATSTYTDTLSQLSLGKHYLLISDGLGCETIDSVVITAATPLFAFISKKTEESCYNQSGDGSITVSVSGGVGPYTVSMVGDTSFVTNDSTTFVALDYGFYAFNVKDSNGCFYNLEDSILAGALPLLTDTTTNYQGCSGIDLIAEVTLSGYNGVGPYTFEWEDGNTDNPRAAVEPGQYIATVTDVNGCSHSDVIVVLNLDSLMLNVSSSLDVTCQADSTGQISVTTTGAFEPYSFSIDNGNTFQTDSLFTGLPIGNYTILVKDDHNCTDTTSATITYTNALTASVLTTNESCILANDGTLEVSILGGIAPFSYSLDNINFQFQNTFSGLSAGTYVVWVEDGSGCKAVYDNNIITEPTLLTLSTNIVTSETCSASNGSISGSAAGGTEPYTYEWNGNPALNNNTLTNVAAGSYTLVVTDANLCTESSTIVLTNSLSPELTLQSSQAEICGMSNGQIDLAITNGTAPFIFNWSHNGTLNDSLATGLSAGTYNVTITDANMCSAVLTTSLTEIAGPTLSLQSNTNPLCTNDNGSFSVALANGTAPFTYSWSHNDSLNNNTATGLPAGNYEVTITDGNGCSDVLTSNLTFEAPPVFGTSTLVNAICGEANGSIQTSVTGGLAPLTYTWSHDPMLNASAATLLPDGNYSVTVTDALGCTSVESNLAIIAQTPPSLNINVTNNSNCLVPMGTISVQTTGGLAPFVYSWSHDGSLTGPNATGLGAGSYTIIVTDSNGCTSTEVASLMDGQGADLSLESSQPEICGMSNGEIDLAISSGTAPYAFNWSHDNTLNDSLATGLPAGDYSITVTDVNMCSAVLTTSIVEITGPTLSLQSNTNPVCTNDNGSIAVALTNGTAPFTYSWSQDTTLNNNTATSLPAGSYAVTVTDGNNCSDVLTANITFEIPPVLAPATFVDATCGEANGSIQTTLTGGVAPLTYQWSHEPTLNSAVATALAGGNYSVTVTDALDCSSVLNNLVVSDLTPPVLSVLSFENTGCGNPTGTINVTTSGGLAPLTYTWGHDAGLTTSTATDLNAGNYNITVTDASGCTSVSSVSIDITDSPILTLQSSSNEICGTSNGEIDLTITSGTAPFTFDWSHSNTLNDSLATGLMAGAYAVTVTDANSCSAVFSTTLTEIAGPTLTLVANNNSVCTDDNGSISVELSNGTAPFTYQWSHNTILNNNTATGLAAGDYEVTVGDANGCTSALNTSISFDTPPDLALITIVNATCDGQNGSIQLTTSGGTAPLTYQWSHDPTLSGDIASLLLGGSYSVTVTDVLGCSTVEDNMTIANLTPPTLNVSSFNNTDCLNAMGDITVQTTGGLAPFFYAWSHDPLLSGTSATGLASGDYSITVTDANGCESIVIQELIAFEGTLAITNELNCSDSSDGSLFLTLQGNPTDYDYEWSDSSIGNTHVATDLSMAMYTVTVTNANGCTQDFSVNLTAPEELTLNISDVIPVGCNGNLGSIVALASGGTGTYTYLWNDANNQNTATANNLTTGIYELLLTDANGCTTTETAEVVEVTPMELTANLLSVLNCFGDENGSVEVVVTQGEAPYTYLWSNNETTSLLTDLPSGNYTVTVTDAVSCTEVLSIPLLAPDLLMAEEIAVQVPLCNGDNNGSVTLNTIGGVAPYQYSWDDNQSQITESATSLISGTYTVLITDANGCTFTEMFTLADPEAIALVSETVSPVSCLGTPNGTIAISAEGGTQGLNYNWSNGATGTNLNDLETGIYQVSLVDGLGCESVESFLVGLTDADPIDLGSADTTLCNNDVIFYDFSDSDYISFEWGSMSEGILSNESSFSTMGEERYYLYALRDDGCEVRDTIAVNFSAATLDAFFIAPTDIVAGDTLVALEVTLPIPDSVFWDYDRDNVFLVDQINNQYLFHFPNTGEYDLTLTSYSENCNNNITKPIFVYADSTELPFFNATVPTIVDLKLFPNPNSGTFSIDVALSGVHDMVIDLYNDKTDLVDRAVFSGEDAYKSEYELDLPAGIYYALVQVAGVRRTVSFVVD